MSSGGEPYLRDGCPGLMYRVTKEAVIVGKDDEWPTCHTQISFPTVGRCGRAAWTAVAHSNGVVFYCHDHGADISPHIALAVMGSP